MGNGAWTVEEGKPSDFDGNIRLFPIKKGPME